MPKIFDNIIQWAQNEDTIRALMLTGSHAEERPPDHFADYDVQIYIGDHTPLTEDYSWLHDIGAVWVCESTGYEYGAYFIPTRLVIYEGGVKVDYAFYPLETFAGVLESSPQQKIILDKDDLANGLQPATRQFITNPKPSQQAFTQAVETFWFEAYHVAKYLKRGDLWLVKFRDNLTKDFLLQMIEWYEQSRHDWHYDTRYMGKQMPEWASDEVWRDLHQVFAHFDATDSWRALLAMMTLFSRLAHAVADVLDYAYPTTAEDNLAAYIRQLSES